MLAMREAVLREARAFGHSLKTSPTDRRDVPIDYRFLELLLEIAEDPDVAIGSFAGGVRVGPGVRMPRLLALCKPKRRWKLPEQSDALDCLEAPVEGDPEWRGNYPASAELSEHVTAVIEDQAERGQVLKLCEQEARKKYPRLVIASLGANRKDKPNGVVLARVLFDGSNGIPVNRRTRIRDQERAQIAADIKRAMSEKSKTGQKTVALSARVSEAHRQLPPGVSNPTWLYRKCEQGWNIRGRISEQLLVPSGVGKPSRTVPGETRFTCVAHARGGRLAVGSKRAVLQGFFFLLCSSLNVLLSWKKTAGRHSRLGWVRAASPQQPTRDLGETGRVADEVGRSSCRFDVYPDEQIRRGLGRIVHVAGALEFERPLLGPLLKFLTIHPRGSVRRVPSHVAIILKYLSHQVERSKHCPCASELVSSEVAPRVDASGVRTGIDGWYPVLGEDGHLDPKRSPWFSLEIRQDQFP